MLRILLCAVVCLFVFTSAKADTFTLTSGAAFTGFNSISLNASGPNVSLHQNSGGEPGNLTFATCTPAPCGPGSVLNVGGVFDANQLNIGFSRGTATINGVTFNDIFLGGTLTFTGSIVLPSDFGNDHPVSVPFSMQGNCKGLLLATRLRLSHRAQHRFLISRWWDPESRVQTFNSSEHAQ